MTENGYDDVLSSSLENLACFRANGVCSVRLWLFSSDLKNKGGKTSVKFYRPFGVR